MIIDFASVLVQKAHQVLTAAGLLQLANRFGFDLTNALASHFENVAHFFERITVTIAKSITQLDDLTFAITKSFQYVIDAIAKHFLPRADRWAFRGPIRQQVAELAVLAVSNWSIQADRIAAHRQHSAGFVDRATGGAGRFFKRWLAAQSLE